MTYHWNFGDGTQSPQAKPTYTYAKPGVYQVVLRVADQLGAIGSAQLVIRVPDDSSIDQPQLVLLPLMIR